MTKIADLTDRLNLLAKRREDEGIYTDAMIASSAAICISALETRLDEAKKALRLIAEGRPDNPVDDPWAFYDDLVGVARRALEGGKIDE